MSEETSLRKQDILQDAVRLFREKGYLASSQSELATLTVILGDICDADQQITVKSSYFSRLLHDLWL